MLEFPTFEEMVAVMNSPSRPPEPLDYAVDYQGQELSDAKMELSADDMIEEIFYMVKDIWKRDKNQISGGGASTSNSGAMEDAILMDNPGQSV
jgi:hypothetical protein